MMHFLDRQQLIQILYNNLKDKSKIHTDKRIVHVDLKESGVEITTKDGSMIAGDILVGADGVHSTVRSEMWRIANTTRPGYISDKAHTG
jgi:2-polyprenyl-6-methoxyphenol hydroxylase-like FAD-dependent oxidoreductase